MVEDALRDGEWEMGDGMGFGERDGGVPGICGSDVESCRRSGIEVEREICGIGETIGIPQYHAMVDNEY